MANKLKVEELPRALNSKDIKYLFEERNHVENLLNTRFNFLTAIFGAIIAGILVASSLEQFRIVLWSGTTIVILLSLVVSRVELKLTILLNKKYEDHYYATTYANDSVNKK